MFGLNSLLIVWLGALAGRIYLGKNILRLPYIDKSRMIHVGFLDLFIYGAFAWLVYLTQYTDLNIVMALVYGFGSRAIVGAVETILSKKKITAKMF